MVGFAKVKYKTSNERRQINFSARLSTGEQRNGDSRAVLIHSFSWAASVFYGYGMKDYLDGPDDELWRARRDWFDGLLLEYENQGNYFIGEQASAMIAQVQSCYCAGAWIAVLILSFTVVETHIRELICNDPRKNSKELLQIAGLDERFQKLRMRRNQLVHVDPDEPCFTVDILWNEHEHEAFKAEATDAIELMLEAFFSEWCT